MTAQSESRWRAQNVATRLGLTFLVLILLGGLAVSGLHMISHYENRDGDPELSLDDLRGAYYGVHKPSPMLDVLEQGHRSDEAEKDLLPAERTILIDWLRGDRLSEDYDNLDLGDMAPAEIIAVRCLDCHDSGAAEAPAAALEAPLEDWSDVKQLAFARNVEPTGVEIVLASLHTHSISLGMMALAVAVLLLGSGWSRGFVGLMILLFSFGLTVDLGCWLLARQNDSFVYGIALGGGLFGVASGISLLAVLVDLWRPRSAAP